MVPYLPPLLKKKKKQFLHEQSSIQPTIRWMRYLFLERLGRVLKNIASDIQNKTSKGLPPTTSTIPEKNKAAV